MGQEAQKRARKSLWVRLSNTPDITRAQLAEHFVRKEYAVKDIKTVENGFLVRCRDEETRVNLLRDYDGVIMEGKRIKTARAEVKLTPDEILELIESRLQVAVDMHGYDRGEHMMIPPTTRRGCFPTHIWM